jgi:rubrerythrin
MRCKVCGHDYPSRYYFAAEDICSKCAEDASDQSSEKGNSEGSEAVEGGVEKGGQPLYCPICGEEDFKKLSASVSRVLQWVSAEDSESPIELYACSGCGYAMLFFSKK